MRTTNGTVQPLEAVITLVAAPADMLHPVQPGGSPAEAGNVIDNRMMQNKGKARRGRVSCSPFTITFLELLDKYRLFGEAVHGYFSIQAVIQTINRCQLDGSC